MLRNARLGLASIGLFLGVFASSLVGCDEVVRDYEGTCQDDANPCTSEQCPGDTTVHIPVTDGTQCILGANVGSCTGGSCMLDCVTNGMPCNCQNDVDCPMDTECAEWSCTAGKCSSKITADGTVVGVDNPGDCQMRVCKSGITKMVPDDMDPPPDVAGDCQKYICVSGTPMPGPDDVDKPADTGCTAGVCMLGVPISMNAPVGTTCPTGVCDSAGMCADCLNASDWMQCGGASCPAKLCNSEKCANNAMCLSGFCVDGYCCNTICTDECKSCGIAGNLGACTNVPYLESDPSYTDMFGTPNVACDNALLCNGNGGCRKRIGKTCAGDADCLSGKCSAPVNLCLGAKGEPCTNSGQCVSGVCNAIGICE